jgi:hypothetical protein
MIRDPSDGTVREKPSKEISLKPNEIGPKSAETASKEITSGLPPTTDPREIDRLNRSRDWLKQRNEGRGR